MEGYSDHSFLENQKYRSYPRNADYNDLPIEYEQRLFVKQPIDFLTGDILEKQKISSMKIQFDN